MDKQEIFERLNLCRMALLETLAKIPEQEMESELVEGQWTIKQILGHMTAWEQTVLDPLVGFVQIGEFNPEIIADHDLWNAEQTARREAMDIQQVIAELETTRKLLIDEASRLTEEQWERVLPAPWGGQGCIANLLSGLAWHENEHLQTIHLWRQDHLAST